MRFGRFFALNMEDFPSLYRKSIGNQLPFEFHVR